LYKEKLNQKVTTGEIQQSIYGVVAKELDSLEEFSSVLGIALYFSLDSLILFVYILVTVHSLFF